MKTQEIEAQSQMTELRKILREFVDPATNEVTDVRSAAIYLSFEALYRVKLLLDEQLIESDYAEIFRAIGDLTADIAWDWARQEDDGLEYC
ncbi:hypothetical protein [Glaciihabitans sp. UYNi722]|uniref:hypothetical protein n=1 Tax=Glaciihabitans sp. UYNi722 TaxID=3156344 RepID=UPI003397F5D8